MGIKAYLQRLQGLLGGGGEEGSAAAVELLGSGNARAEAVGQRRLLGALRGRLRQ